MIGPAGLPCVANGYVDPSSLTVKASGKSSIAPLPVVRQNKKALDPAAKRASRHKNRPTN